MEKIFEKLQRFFSRQLQWAVLDDIKGRWLVEAKPSSIAYLKAQNKNGRHILIKPASKAEPYYMLADDLSQELLLRHHQDKNGNFRPGRMIVQTSPGNFQVWIHSSRFLTLEDKQYWLFKLKSDPSAHPNNRFGRCPGFRNRKLKHRDRYGGFPLARLIWIDWTTRAVIPKYFSPPPPGGDVCHKNYISRTQYERGDESATDFAYAMALIRKGFSDEAIAQRLMVERSNWENHQGEKRRQDYLSRTIRKARIYVNKN